MDSDKITNQNQGAHPLSSSSPASHHKASSQNAFEKVLQREERELLGDRSAVDDNPNDSMSKSTPSMSTLVNPNQVMAKNPFGGLQPSPRDNRTMKANPFLLIAEAKKQTTTAPDPTGANLPSAESVGIPSMAKQNSETSKEVVRGPNIKFENLGFSSDELIAGELLVTYIKCTVMLIQYPVIYSNGQLIITNYRVVFKPDDENFFRRYPLRKDYMSIPMSFIYKLERSLDKRDPVISFIDIYSKDGRTIRLRFKEGTESSATLQYLQIYSFPDKKDYFFAFDHYKAARELEEKYQGWKIYDIEKEFKRQGVDFIPLQNNENITNARFRIIENKGFRLCATYPPLLLVPSKMNDQAIIASSRFRTKERFPAVTYYYAKKGTVLSRSSQSKPGLVQSRCPEDEILLRYLGNPNYDQARDPEPNDVDLYIFDARPFLNAMANRVNGKGYEDTRWYRNCEIEFMDIDNIHHVRDAHKKLISQCFSSEISNFKWYSQLEATNWLDLMSYIMTASSKVAQCLQRGKNCLVHCSDGWDRTAQILSLAQIMLDPYFRTIEGFEVLVMKDWVNFGHQFSLRIGHGNKHEKDDQRSPIFLQFLDCVQQLLHQFPFAFEFNDAFLAEIAYNAYSCRFGNFLCNTYQEIILYQCETRTVSIWSYLNSQKQKYINPFYGSVHEHESLVLRPSSHLKHFRLWEEHFLYYSWLSKPNYSLSDNVNFSKDFFSHIFQKEREKSASFRNEIERLKKKLIDAGIEVTDEQEIVHANGEAEIKKKDTEELDARNLEGDKVQSEIKEQEEEEIIAAKEEHGVLKQD